MSAGTLRADVVWEGAAAAGAAAWLVLVVPALFPDPQPATITAAAMARQTLNGFKVGKASARGVRSQWR
jgi:hypothetical protein